jgi:hypothetical protein
MRDQQPARILSFPATPRLRQGDTTSGRRGGVLVRLHADRVVDARTNAAWDELLSLAHLAWNWRDPDSLDHVQRAIARVRRGVKTDWS